MNIIPAENDDRVEYHGDTHWLIEEDVLIEYQTWNGGFFDKLKLLPQRRNTLA